MDRHGIEFTFSAKVWYSEWYFVALPKELAKEIRAMKKCEEEGWGRLKVMAKTGGSEWETAIWFDTKSETYLLPLKAAIRKKEKIECDSHVKISIWV
ncbi:MAG TPA: DUF1905 domain-containing protein [Ruminococcaceae bacterium]|nr:DUF1905 domain-containing protein [Oscillospiraceae bacterium]